MSSPNEIHSLKRPIGLLVAVIFLVIVAKAIGAGTWVNQLRDQIEQLGTTGILVFVLAYVVGVVTIVPGSALTLIAGAIFGPVLGIVLVSIGATIGAGLAFLIARYFAREPISEWLSRSERFQKLDALTETHGSFMVALTRLVPILPFNLLNYAFGLTRVPFSTYMFWSWVCMLPATAIYVLGMDVVTRALAEGRISWALAGLTAFLVGLLTFLNRFARRKLGDPARRAKIPDRH